MTVHNCGRLKILKSAVTSINIYETKSSIIFVGYDIELDIYRILEIKRSVLQCNDSLDMKTYSTTFTKDALDARLKKLGAIYGTLKLIHRNVKLIFGFIKLVQSFYAIIVKDIKEVASVHGNCIYTPTSVDYIPITWNLESSSQEGKYMNTLKGMDLTSNFYFSFTYDLTSTFQKNNLKSSQGGYLDCVDMFAWNAFALKPLLDAIDHEEVQTNYRKTVETFDEKSFSSSSHSESKEESLNGLLPWIVPVTYGYINERIFKLHNSNSRLRYILISRRSRKFAGTRLLRRGINDAGSTANEVETEQIISKEIGVGNGGGVWKYRSSSLVQVRGSIPLFWSHDNLYALKPGVVLEPMDEAKLATKRHFSDLFRRYGNHVTIISLLRMVRSKQEIKLGAEYKKVIAQLSGDGQNYHKMTRKERRASTYSLMKKIQQSNQANSDRDSRDTYGDANDPNNGVNSSNNYHFDLEKDGEFPIEYIGYDFLHGKNIFNTIHEISKEVLTKSGFFVQPLNEACSIEDYEVTVGREWSPQLYKLICESNVQGSLPYKKKREGTSIRSRTNSRSTSDEFDNNNVNNSMNSEHLHSTRKFDIIAEEEEDDDDDSNDDEDCSNDSNEDPDEDTLDEKNDKYTMRNSDTNTNNMNANRLSSRNLGDSFSSSSSPNEEKKKSYFSNFHKMLGEGLRQGLLQRGIVRTNCVDCLDRTNVSQFCYARECLPMQLKAIGIDLTESSLQNLIHGFIELWSENGDYMAKQYAGSGAMHKLTSNSNSNNNNNNNNNNEEEEEAFERSIILASGVGNKLEAVKRYYSNISTDFDRQHSIDLLLGIMEPIAGDDKNIKTARPEELRNTRGKRKSDTIQTISWEHTGIRDTLGDLVLNPREFVMSIPKIILVEANHPSIVSNELVGKRGHGMELTSNFSNNNINMRYQIDKQFTSDLTSFDTLLNSCNINSTNDNNNNNNFNRSSGSVEVNSKLIWSAYPAYDDNAFNTKNNSNNNSNNIDRIISVENDIDSDEDMNNLSEIYKNYVSLDTLLSNRKDYAFEREKQQEKLRKRLDSARSITSDSRRVSRMERVDSEVVEEFIGEPVDTEIKGLLMKRGEKVEYDDDAGDDEEEVEDNDYLTNFQQISHKSVFRTDSVNSNTDSSMGMSDNTKNNAHDIVSPKRKNKNKLFKVPKFLKSKSKKDKTANDNEN